MPVSRSEIEGRARALFGEPNRRQSTSRELRFGKKGSISVSLDGDSAGLWYSFESLQGGSVLRHGEKPNTPPVRQSGPLTWDSDSEHQFQRVIDGELSTITPSSPPALYLRRRGIDRWPDHSVRAWRYGVAFLARTKSGSILALQVTPLTPDGRKNPFYWQDGVTKRTYAACRGWHHFAAVRHPGRGELILCEGPETGLSVWIATGRPVCACLGAAGIRHLRTGRRVTIAADCDPIGSPAAGVLGQTIETREAQQQRVRVASPPNIDDPIWNGNPPTKKTDWNDVHVRLGIDVVRGMFSK